MENHIWKHNAKLPITIYEEHWSLSCTVLSLIYSNIKKGACQLVACYIIFSPTQKTPIKGAFEERKKEICSEIDFSLSLSL